MSRVAVDGYLAYTFCPRGTDYYLRCLLKTEPSRLSVVLEHGRFLTYNPPSVTMTPTSMDAYNRPRYLLDLAANVRLGTIVPQKIWVPTAPGDFQRHVAGAQLQMPIFFVQSTGAIGIPLAWAAGGVTQSLYNATAQAPMGGKTTTHFCLNWPGYGEFTRQVEIQSHHAPISMDRLARRIGSVIDMFIEEKANVNPTDPNWKVSKYQGHGITRNDITIIGMVHVSAGKWMPMLQVNRHIVTM
ncbi:hypothetical protein OF83DRAFT_175373 [Amylostereum chailletii]|nr:hypothetical protein OF83DRAFT_175373 [Amylostereum chailletii]